MLQVCDRIVLGLARASAMPAGRLQTILDIVATWGNAHFGPGVDTPQDLCGKMQAMAFEELAERPGISGRLAHVFIVTSMRIFQSTTLRGAHGQ